MNHQSWLERHSSCSLAAGSPGASSGTQLICGVSFGLHSRRRLALSCLSRCAQDVLSQDVMTSALCTGRARL
ncbi:hypothetical protein NBRC111894_2076 [Sporolactobacillus inulinus]|uniref:Uncharacterized protein n=1 Tax=Sporolactobacillus inulinus TaxID=2078 RepID=A0A4Y1ZBQ0_9BACL|nr:hypothetical protein NBRC111894_2076 [Sporolactobacillus inulinus]